LPFQGQFIEPLISKGVMWYSGLYVGDSFRMTPKLTLNGGVRWEQPGSFTETHGSLTTLIPNMATGLPNVNSNPLTGGLALINSPQWPHNQWQDLKWKLFSPRVGFAYSPTQKNTVSGGFGISYLPPTVAFSSGPYNVPNNQGTTNMNTYLNTGTVTGSDTLDNPSASALIQPSGRSQAGLDALVGNGIQAMLFDQPYPYYMQWNVGIQHQFGSSSSVRLAYVGSRGIHLPLFSVNMDQLPDQYDVCGYDSSQPQCFYIGDNKQHLLSDKVANPMAGFINVKLNPTLGAATIPFGYLLKPHPQYLYMSALGPSIGDTTYRRFRSLPKSSSELTVC